LGIEIDANARMRSSDADGAFSNCADDDFTLSPSVSTVQIAKSKATRWRWVWILSGKPSNH
jgi:hypothetical protein